MKIRIIKKLVDSVFHIRIQTEDWSEYDRELMLKYGEPEINIGGVVIYEPCGQSSSSEEYASVTFDDAYMRIMTESPFTRKFDARDFDDSIDDAKAAATAWANDILRKIELSVTELRAKDSFFTTEEITEL